jgi:gas vesicle protein
LNLSFEKLNSLSLFARVTLSKDVQESMDGIQKQLKHLVAQMNDEYDHQVGAERTHKQVMEHLNAHHQLIQSLTTAAREMEEDVAELEAQQGRY